MQRILAPSKSQQSLNLPNERVKGEFYDFQLVVQLTEKGELQLKIASIQTVQPHKPRFAFMPLNLLPRLHDIFANWLKEYDGTQQLGIEPQFYGELFDKIEDVEIDNGESKGVSRGLYFCFLLILSKFRDN